MPCFNGSSSFEVPEKPRKPQEVTVTSIARREEIYEEKEEIYEEPREAYEEWEEDFGEEHEYELREEGYEEGEERWEEAYEEREITYEEKRIIEEEGILELHHFINLFPLLSTSLPHFSYLLASLNL